MLKGAGLIALGETPFRCSDFLVLIRNREARGSLLKRQAK